MLRLFRQIRLHHLSEGKTGKYMRYAIGEIVLVVVGILIALQINQWNGQRIETKELQILTKNLNNEFQSNLQELELDKIRIHRKISSSKTLLSFTGPKNMEVDVLVIDSLMYDAIDNPTWNPSSYVLNDIKISGRLSTLKNEKLKILLYDWDRLYEDIIEWHEGLNISSKDLIDFITKKGSLVNVDNFGEGNNSASKFDVKNFDLLQEIRFENVLENSLYTARGLEDRYLKAIMLLKEIVAISNSHQITE